MVDLQYYILFWVCILGLCFGSFFNVVILRTLSNESIVFPPSKCPKCNNKLLWWHNIPVLSYILLRGKCYFCKEKISIQYPVVELIINDPVWSYIPEIWTKHYSVICYLLDILPYYNDRHRHQRKTC